MPAHDANPAPTNGPTDGPPEVNLPGNDGGAASRSRGNIKMGLLFLAPNIVGFLAFTMIPLVFSLVFAFTNWDLKYHNRYKEELPSFIGLGNFFALFEKPDFVTYLGNTLFFMMGIPFGIAGSLIAALLLSRELKGTRRVNRRLSGVAFVFVGIVMAASFAAYFAGGGGILAMVVLFAGVVSVVVLGGVFGGQSVYRTLFYLPHFTSGVATFILWKALFNPQQGPLTLALQGPLRWLTGVINASPPGLVRGLGVLLIALAAAVLVFGLSRLVRFFRDGDLGSTATFIPFGLLMLPAVMAFFWYGVLGGGEGKAGAATAITQTFGGFYVAIAVIAGLLTILLFLRGQGLKSRPMEGFGSAFILAAALMVAQFILIGLAAVAVGLPGAAAAADGLEPPKWLSDPRWVKPSLMLVGFWGAIGSNTMLLYLAALTNVPGELYEAADIDGARPFQRFWNVTWPQLAPTTFFVVVMGTIGGLQGGFEMVRTMTTGGPGGASTPLAYYVYTEGFEVGRIGFASGVAWALFLLILAITLFNWTFGNKYVND